MNKTRTSRMENSAKSAMNAPHSAIQGIARTTIVDKIILFFLLPIVRVDKIEGIAQPYPNMNGIICDPERFIFLKIPSTSIANLGRNPKSSRKLNAV